MGRKLADAIRNGLGQAEDGDAVLLLGELDSCLRERRTAMRWCREKQANEILAQAMARAKPGSLRAVRSCS